MHACHLAWLEAKAVHAGVRLDVDAERRARWRRLEHLHLRLVVNDDGEFQLPAGGNVRWRKEAFEHQQRPAPPGLADTSGFLEVDQRNAIGGAEALHSAFYAMAVGVGLDHSPESTTGRSAAGHFEIVAHRGEVNARVDRTGHVDGVGSRET